jgi:hypothetical protein
MPKLDLGRLPIVFGVTGHRDVRAEDEPVLRAAIEAIFARFEAAYPSTPLLLLTPLAEGADQLAAEVAVRRGIPFRVPIPMPLPQYRDDFTGADRLAKFDALLSRADGPPYEMPYYGDTTAANAGDEARRAHQYALLASHLSRAAHVLIALWDGVPSGTTGGTAQAVRFRVLGVPECYRRRSYIDAPETGPVYHIWTPRAGGAEPLEAAGRLRLCVRRTRGSAGPRFPNSLAEQFEDIAAVPDGAPDPFTGLYGRIETFNRDCALVPRSAPAVPESAAGSLRAVAENVATFYQRKYVAALRTIFFATAAAVLTFFLYADIVPQAHPIVVFYLIAFALAVATYFNARNARWQDRSQDYRALEIGLHVQQAWDAAGLQSSVADFYLRRQQSELDWIRDAIRTAHTVDRQRPFDEAHATAAVRDFVLRQYAYFAGTAADERVAAIDGSAPVAGRAQRERRKADLLRRLNRLALRLSFSFSLVLITYGLLAWLAPERAAFAADESRWHGYLMFAIGITAAAAALFGEYSSRRAHAQQMRRYDVMAAIYRRALDALDEAAQQSAWRDPGDGPRPSLLETARACILELGHEALSENSDWLLMHREQPLQLISVR